MRHKIRNNQCARPNLRQRNSLTITGLVSGPIPALRRWGSTSQIKLRVRRSSTDNSSVILPAERARSKIFKFKRLTVQNAERPIVTIARQAYFSGVPPPLIRPWLVTSPCPRISITAVKGETQRNQLATGVQIDSCPCNTRCGPSVTTVRTRTRP